MLNIQRNIILNILQWKVRACYVEQQEKKIKKESKTDKFLYLYSVRKK